MEITENVEEYLEALFILEEKGKKIAKISEVAEGLKVTSPSAVEMLKKIEKGGLVDYRVREGVSLTKRGRKLARRIIRNHRITELLLTEILSVDIDDGLHEGMVCAIEHHISDKMTDAVCTKLDHPRKCPHGNNIPSGNCCPRY
jgi:DtxR family Mn-dependent transcriptional regulator